MATRRCIVDTMAIRRYIVNIMPTRRHIVNTMPTRRHIVDKMVKRNEQRKVAIKWSWGNFMKTLKKVETLSNCY